MAQGVLAAWLAIQEKLGNWTRGGSGWREDKYTGLSAISSKGEAEMNGRV